jgi:phage terminase Nu1 subunit (DNA packaging protein)
MIIKIQDAEVSGRDLADFFQKSRQTIRAWTSKGMPKNRRGAYPLLKCFSWWLDNVCSDGHDTTLSEERRQKVVIERQIKELELEEKRGSLVLKWLGDIVREVRQHLLSLPRRVAASLVLLSDERDIELALRKEIFQILNRLVGVKDEKAKN